MLISPANPETLRKAAIAEYHDCLASDEALTADVLAQLRDAMRARKIVYAGEPLGVSLRPHVLTERQFSKLTKYAELVASALEKLATAAVDSPAVMGELGVTASEEPLARIDPGFRISGVSTRIDSFVHEQTIKFVEYNGENPSSLSDQEALNEILLQLPAMAAFAERYSLRGFSPSKRLLQTLLATYREWGGNARPRVAIVDWNNLPTATEFELLRDLFLANDVPTIICSPDELEYSCGKLRCDDFAIDLVYKRVLIHELLARCDITHPLLRACEERQVCLVNPFRCKLMHKKASFELLETHASWFTTKEREAIARCVPWTRRVRERRTTRNAREIDLLPFIRANRERLVLKPNDDYGGHGIVVGSRVNDSAWDAAIDRALGNDYIVQDAVEPASELFPIFDDHGWELKPMFVDTNPFLFNGKVCGAMVRLSASPVVNVTAGGGETGFFVSDRLD